MSDNKDLEDRVNELERAKLQKRIAELEAELGMKPNVGEPEPKPKAAEPEPKPNVAELEPKPNVKEKPTGRMPGWSRAIILLIILIVIGSAIFLSGGISSLASRFGLSIGVSDGGESTYSISGAVTGADLAGLAGVTINLTGAATASTTTDASGNFTFMGLAYGSYTVTPVKEGFTFTPTRQVKVVNGANITGVNFMATDSAYIYIPGAIFHEGPPPPASGISTDLVVTSATPSGSLYLNSTITWTVTWVVTAVTVTYVDLYIPELGGYFEYEVTPEEAVAGKAQLDMVESFTLPPTESCTPICRLCTCYVKAPEATTESLETSFSLVADEGSIGVTYLGGAGLHIAGCGDSFCMDTEDSFSCPRDCPVVCGNLVCENGENNSTCPGDCRTAGCMDPNATNYDPQAGWNDGSCKYTNGFAFFGCMDPNATNYDPSASQDNGKCTYEDVVVSPDSGLACSDVNPCGTFGNIQIIEVTPPERCGCPEGTVDSGKGVSQSAYGPYLTCVCVYK